MKVFISWSGERSKRTAAAFRKYLPLMINAIKPWVSAEDLAKGARWSAEIAKELDESEFGIICLTPENWEKPWVNFESGALAKKFDQKLYPFFLSFRATDIVGPLTQFQSTHFDEQEIYRMIESLNQGLGQQALESSHLREVFGAFWTKLKADLDAAQAVKTTEEKTPKISTEALASDLLTEVRAQSRTLEHLQKALGQVERLIQTQSEKSALTAYLKNAKNRYLAVDDSGKFSKWADTLEQAAARLGVSADDLLAMSNEEILSRCEMYDEAAAKEVGRYVMALRDFANRRMDVKKGD